MSAHQKLTPQSAQDVTATTAWQVIPSPTDAELSAVQGAYLVADLLPVEDASLIAAAPDLLDELREARTTLNIVRTQIMVEIAGGRERWQYVPEALQARLNSIDAAIEKATAA